MTLISCSHVYPTTGDGNGKGGHGHWSVHEAAKEGPRAGGGEKEAAGQHGEDGGAQQAQGNAHETGTKTPKFTFGPMTKVILLKTSPVCFAIVKQIIFLCLKGV